MGYESRGGVAGTEFSLEELERSSTMLATAGAELFEGAAKLALSPQPPAALLLLGAVLMRQRVLAAANGVIELAGMCSARAAEAGGLALRVQAAREVYEQAESQATRQINDARGALLPLILMWDLATNKGRPCTDTMEDLINQAPAMIGALLPGPAGAVALLRDREHGGLFDTSVAQRLYPMLGPGLAGLGLVQTGPVEVAALNGTRTVETRGALDTMLDLQAIAEQEPPGSLLVSTVQGGGAPVHIVTIPGTQSDPLREGLESVKGLAGVKQGSTGMNPWDTAGIAEAMGFGSQHVSVAVGEALAQAGAKPGDTVVLGGYSQGGIHAANLAGDTRLSDTFDMSYVLTVGSPVALAALPKATKALHLEDRRDMVPGTDGSRNPAGRNRVTVYFDGPDPSEELPNTGFGPAHKLANYREHARELKGAADPGIAESTGQLATLLAGSGALTVRSYQLRRVVPSGKSAAAPKLAENGRPLKGKLKDVPPVTSGWG
ncbi:hypothetical protein ACFY5D_09165 [Paeniglutamicibacter sp. NPDC012692]|uniref:hypothetical protein n=1 Tax=Paeniglutamicibacter sp. NPDC012692 TaxID=3364388 RepID=UPI003682B94C